MSVSHFQLDDEPTGFQDIINLVEQSQKLSLSPHAIDCIIKCRKYLDKKLKDTDKSFYGINTGFGYLQNIRIDKTQLLNLQTNLIKSHACGLGEEVPLPIVKLMLLLKVKSLCFGYSGVQLATVERLLEMYNKEVLPVVYTQGSLGASGDLSPLSHLSLPLIGLGEVCFEKRKMPSATALEKMGWSPIALQSKEGLALINGTQFMCAYGIFTLMQCRRLLKWADAISAISFDAFDCSISPFHERIHAVRAHQGQVDTAAAMRKLLSGSSLASQDKSQVQDPYSFRCIPQVHGATRDSYAHVLGVFIQEINSVTDNPNIFPDDDLIISGGNFHGQPLALCLDFLAIAMAELGNIAERRTFQLLSGQRNLPLFLAKDPGLNSGLMVPQYTAAGIVSENKQLCTPSSVDSIPSSNNQEDHVSMGANAAVKCKRVVDNVEKLLAIELLTAAQALEFRRPLKSSAAIEDIVLAFRKEVSFNDGDRVMYEDMCKAIEFIKRNDP